MSTNPSITVNSLKGKPKEWTLRLSTLRIGTEITCGTKNSTRIKKLIMIDEEGTEIGVVLFNDDIQYFGGMFELNKTYLISNGQVQQPNKDFFNANSDVQLVLKKYTSVKESDEHIKVDGLVLYKFINFRDVDPAIHNKEAIDICGILIKVKAIKEIKNERGVTKKVREIALINTEYNSIVVSLWEDMAINEGYGLEQIEDANPIVSVSKVTAKIYQGQVQLQTTSASILQINPTNAESELLQTWSININDKFALNEMLMHERIKNSREVTLADIIYNRASLVEDKYYSFKAMFQKVGNKSYIFYDSCKTCASSIYKNNDVVTCKKCNKEVSETMPRYRVLLNVTQGNETALLTLFEEAATSFVGCPIEEYMTSIKDGENESRYFRGLSLKSMTEFRFLFALNNKAKVINGELNAVADAIDKIQSKAKHPLIDNTPKSEAKQDKIPEKKRTQHTRKGRKNLANKGVETQQVNISSDDEETISQMMKKAKSCSQKRSVAK